MFLTQFLDFVGLIFLKQFLAISRLRQGCELLFVSCCLSASLFIYLVQLTLHYKCNLSK